MITIKEGIYQIKNLTEKRHLSRNNRWSDRWIYKEILNYRSRLIRQKFDQNIPILQSNFQETPCIRLIKRPISECICLESNPDCTLLRSEYIIPKTIIPIKNVFNPLNTKEYQVVDISKLKYRLSNRFKSLSEKTTAYLSDTGGGEYLYVITQNPVLSNVVISGIFEDPLEIQTYPDCNGKVKFPCRSNFDYELKIDNYLFTTVKEMIMQGLNFDRNPPEASGNPDRNT